MKLGFTLIELIVSLSIIVLVASVGVPAFRYFGAQEELNHSAQLVASQLQEAQALSLAPRASQVVSDTQYFVEFVLPKQYNLGAIKQDGSIEVLRQSTLSKEISFESVLPQIRWVFQVNNGGRLPGSSQHRLVMTHTKPGVPSKTVVANPSSGLIEVK